MIISPTLVREMREDAIGLIQECRWLLSAAARIKKGSSDIGRRSQAQTKLKSATTLTIVSNVWKRYQVLFAESLVELSDHLEIIRSPTNEQLEILESLASPMSLLGISSTSRIQLAHLLAGQIINSIGIAINPIGHLGSVSSLIPKSPSKLSKVHATQIIKLAQQVAAVGSLTDVQASDVVTGIRSEAAKIIGNSDTTPDYHMYCPVQLFPRSNDALILDTFVAIKTVPQYKVIEALCKVYPKGLSKDELPVKSKCGDARGILRRLCNHDERWAQVVNLPKSKHGGGYRLVWP